VLGERRCSIKRPAKWSSSTTFPSSFLFSLSPTGGVSSGLFSRLPTGEGIYAQSRSPSGPIQSDREKTARHHGKKWKADQQSLAPRSLEEAGEDPLGRTPARAVRPSRWREERNPEVELRPAGARVRSLDRRGGRLVGAQSKGKTLVALVGKENPPEAGMLPASGGE
jgi:hypothetical protein